jgi:hypothetical protein
MAAFRVTSSDGPGCLAIIAAKWAGKRGAARKVEIEVETSGLDGKPTLSDQPRRQESQGGLEKFIFIHGVVPP